MARFLVRRIGLTVITVLCVSIILFAVAQILPGDVGRAIEAALGAVGRGGD